MPRYDYTPFEVRTPPELGGPGTAQDLYPVAIIGAGPVGLAAAIDLATRGIACNVGSAAGMRVLALFMTLAATTGQACVIVGAIDQSDINFADAIFDATLLELTEATENWGYLSFDVAEIYKGNLRDSDPNSFVVTWPLRMDEASALSTGTSYLVGIVWPDNEALGTEIPQYNPTPDDPTLVHDFCAPFPFMFELGSREQLVLMESITIQ